MCCCLAALLNEQRVRLLLDVVENSLPGERGLVMPDVVQGTLSDMQGAATTFARHAEECRSSLQTVNIAANNLRTGWKGQGNESFEAVMARFHATGQALLQELDEIGRNVNLSAQAFSQLDSDLRSAWQGFGG